jgi:hypothetical protein
LQNTQTFFFGLRVGVFAIVVLLLFQSPVSDGDGVVLGVIGPGDPVTGLSVPL